MVKTNFIIQLCLWFSLNSFKKVATVLFSYSSEQVSCSTPLLSDNFQRRFVHCHLAATVVKESCHLLLCICSVMYRTDLQNGSILLYVTKELQQVIVDII